MHILKEYIIFDSIKTHQISRNKCLKGCITLYAKNYTQKIQEKQNYSYVLFIRVCVCVFVYSIALIIGLEIW